MAKVRPVCDGFFVFAVIISLFLPCFLAQENHNYFYTTNLSTSKPTQSINLQLIKLSHDIKKRGAADTDVLPLSIFNDTKAADVTAEAPSPVKRILERRPSDVKESVAQPPLNREVRPEKTLLGENGTGVRWQNATVTSQTPSPKSNINLARDNVSPPDRNLDWTAEDEDILKFFEDRAKKFEDEVKKNQYTVNVTDTHIYYNSTFMTMPEIEDRYWVDFSNSKDVVTHDLLSMSHRRAATVKLNFDFPFYGHLIRNVTVATGGFIYTGDYVHSWLAATQYIAPLMANFDTSISNDSFIKFLDNDTSFTVQWENVSLQDKPNEGKFTFQATLHKSGDIVFAYMNVPDIIKSIQDIYHPVTIGLSDAYIIDNAEYYVHRKTIFEYHKVSFSKDQIRNSTVIYLTALPTCLGKKDCQTCMNSSDTAFKCFWCPVTARCSNGVDRFRHEWLQKNCEKKQIQTLSDCQAVYTTDEDDQHFVNFTSLSPREMLQHALAGRMSPADGGPSAVIIGLFLICVLSLMVLWVVYAYRNPHTTSGQLLIRYRPSQWRWRRGEARYTAATIHM